MSTVKAAHVNMMTDTVIANLPPDGLRQVIRGMLSGDVTITAQFNALALTYIINNTPNQSRNFFVLENGVLHATQAFHAHQSRYRCLMGCGHGCQCMEALSEVVQQFRDLDLGGDEVLGVDFQVVLASIDGDIVQCMTAVMKELTSASGTRPLCPTEVSQIEKLQTVLQTSREQCLKRSQEFPFQRGIDRLVPEMGKPAVSMHINDTTTKRLKNISQTLEYTRLGTLEVPRMFMGLWQFSSPSWGTASKSRIDKHFREHVDAGFVAYDMADHYGDAEITFGDFRASQPDGAELYCATKWAVFEPIKISAEVVKASIEDRLRAVRSDKIELLQFHWQDYNDHQYIEACKLIAQHQGVQSLGLCNFDTEHMEEIIGSGVPVVSNQVQFSLVDPRPRFAMGASCTRHDVKLLTYGSLCGGFLAGKWLGRPAPNLFDEHMTPSHRKYLEMIAIWGGWALFQELLGILAKIGENHRVSVSNVAVRWVLDHEFVGAVIVGARMGISAHVEENLKAFSFRLRAEDRALIEEVLGRSRAREVFETMGDCGAEYR